MLIRVVKIISFRVFYDDFEKGSLEVSNKLAYLIQSRIIYM